MSKPIFAPAAAAAVNAVIASCRHAQQRGRREHEPGLRIIDGRLLYSAAWLDASTARRPSDAEVCWARRAGDRRG